MTGFLENKGQMMDDNFKPVPFVLFKAEAPGVDLYVTTSGLTYVFFKMDEEEEKERENGVHTLNGKGPERTTIKAERLDMLLPGAVIRPENVTCELPQQGERNYFLPHCPDGIYGVKSYAKITIREVYPGIDWVLYNTERNGFKYDFVVHPGANHRDIILEYISRSRPELTTDGALLVTHSFGSLYEKAPVCLDGSRSSTLVSRFEIASQTREGPVCHTVLKFDVKRPANNGSMIIDPQLVWSTFLGGNANDGIMAIEADQTGNLFATGYSDVPGFPLVNAGTYYQTTGSSRLLVIAKFSATGALVWSTYYGGSGTQNVFAIDTDLSGNVFVAGSTDAANFPVLNGTGYFQSTKAGSADAFILKFGNTGQRLWATFYGGSGLDEASSVICTSSGQVYLAGRTLSTDFPLQNSGGYYQSTVTSSTSSVLFIARFTNAGSRSWSTYFGESFLYAASLSSDNNGNVFMSSTSNAYQSGGAQPTVNPGGGAYFQPTANSTNGEILISKFSPSDNLVWSTFYGGSGQETSGSIGTDPLGNVYICGTTSSTDLPVMNAGTYFQGTLAGITNAYISKFSNNGNLLWSTYYGNGGYNASNYGDGMAIDTCGNLFLMFTTATTSFTTVYPCDGNFLRQNQGGSDDYLCWFAPNGTLNWATYLGGAGNDFRAALSTDRLGYLYASGEWISATSSSYTLVPSTGAYFQPAPAGSDDSFVAKFGVAQPDNPNAFVVYPPVICLTATTPAVISPTIYSQGGTFSASPGLSIHPSTGAITVSATPAGTYTISYGPVTCGCLTSAMLTRTIVLGIPPSITVTNTNVCSGVTGTVVALASPSAGATYSWNTGTTASSLVVTLLSDAFYLLQVTSPEGCTTSSVVQVSVKPNPAVTISGATMICAGESCTQTAGGAASYTWSTGVLSPTLIMTPPATTTMNVTGKDINGCTATTSAIITVKPAPQIKALNDTVCAGSAAVLSVSSSDSQTTFTWLPGYVGMNLPVAPPFDPYYKVTASLNGCNASDSARVVQNPTVMPETAFSYSASFCYPRDRFAQPVFAAGFQKNGLFGSAPEVIIAPSTGDIDLSLTQPGTHQVGYTVAATGCTLQGASNATVTVENPVHLVLSRSRKLAPGESLQLSVAGASEYTWSPASWLSCVNCSDPIASPPGRAEYCVMAQRGRCMETACVLVDVGCQTEDELDVPNAFTPDNDGHNDRYCLKGWHICMVRFKMMIYDRWGEMVFETSDPKDCWDGTFHGRQLNTAVFVYVIDAEYEDGLRARRKGNITLIR